MVVTLNITPSPTAKAFKLETIRPFNEFVQKLCPGTSLEKAMQLVNEGYNFVKDLEGNIVPKEQKMMMAPFHWYLMYLAIKQENSYFQEGMIVFKDPGHKIINFFKEAEGCYPRWSSHFCGRVPQKGCLRLNTNAIDLPLSAQMQTVIFSELEMDDKSEWSMIKAEEDPVGCGKPISTLLHTWKWFTRRILNWITPNERNEYIPSAVIAKFKTLIPTTDEILKKVHRFGLAAINQHIPNFATTHPLATGNEVVLPSLLP